MAPVTRDVTSGTQVELRVSVNKKQLGPVEGQPALFPGPNIPIGTRANHEALPTHDHQKVHGAHGFHHDHLAGQVRPGSVCF